MITVAHAMQDEKPVDSDPEFETEEDVSPAGEAQSENAAADQAGHDIQSAGTG